MDILKTLSIFRFELLQIRIGLFQRNISFPLISNDFCVLADVCFKKWFERSRRRIVDTLSISTSNTAFYNFKSDNDEFFVSFASTLFAFFLSANIKFINMNYTADWI